MSEPLNYDPNDPAAEMARYPVYVTHGQPTESAHAYLDWIEGCFAEALQRIGAVELRLRALEASHADLNAIFSRRVTEFESRLDHAQAEIKDLKLVALHLSERINALEPGNQ
jgi:hypothetical protein